jgi:hypothetical protein
MVRKTHPPHQGGSLGGGMIMGGGESSGFSYVGGERLKQVDTPVETLLGAANGAVSGALVSGAVSLAVTAGKEGTHALLQKGMHNITGNHLLAVLAGTTALAGLGGLVRFSRARKHNEWSEKHYAFLEQQAAAREQGAAERISGDRARGEDNGPER